MRIKNIFRFNSKKIFFKLFVVYSAVLFAIIVFSVFLIGKIYISALNSEMNKTYSEIIKNAKSDSIAGISNADTNALRLLNNNEIIAFFTDFYDNSMDKRLNRYNVIGELRATCNNVHEIESIAVYDLNSNYVLTNSGGYTKEEYKASNGVKNDILTSSAENDVTEYVGIAGEDRGMYIIRSYPLNANNQRIKGYVMIEINKNYISRLFAENLPSNTKYRICDGDGGVIFGNIDTTASLPSPEEMPTDKSGKNIRLNNKKYILFCNCDAESVPWSFYMLVDYGESSNVVRTLIAAEILIGLLTFAFGLFVTYFASKTTCNPIDEFFERTVSRIHDIGSAYNTGDSNKYSYESIEMIMNKIIMDDQQMREAISESLPSRKWNLMIKLLSGEVQTFSEISAAANILGINLYEGNYAIMLSEFEDSEDNDYFAIYAPMMCKRIESVDGCMAVVTIGNRVIAFMSSMLDDDEFKEHIRSLNTKISQTFDNLYGKKYNAGVSNIFHELSNVKGAYEQSLKCLDFDFVSQHDGLIFYSDINDYSDEIFIPFIKKSVKIGEAVKKRDKAEAQGCVNSIFDIMRGRHFPKQHLRYIIDLIRYELLETMQDMGVTVPEAMQNMQSEDIVSHNDIEKICSLITNEVTDAIEYVQSEVDDLSSKATMERIIAYVNENYKNSSISIAELGDAMNISSTYITNGFKKFEGMSFYEYLTQLRMNEAGRLLLKTSKKIYEIADEVGYTSSQSFIRVFKKYYGLTPDKFRNNNSIQ